MKIRGSLNITKNLKLDNPGGTAPGDGSVLRNTLDGTVYFGNTVVEETKGKIYKEMGSMVTSAGKVYISTAADANGSLPLDANFWMEIGATAPVAPPATGCDCVSTKQIGPYPPGTPLEDVIIGLHYGVDISNLDVVGYSDTVDETMDVVEPTLTWDVIGAPTNMILADSDGQINNVDVTGLTSYKAVGKTYSKSAGEKVFWTLSADGVSTALQTSIEWITTATTNMTYYGTLTHNGTPTEAEILAGTGADINTNPTASLFIGDTITSTYFFMAIPMVQNHEFSKWHYLSDPSWEYLIGDPSDLLYDRGTVVVNGIDYHVYSSSYITTMPDDQGLKMYN